MRMVILFNHDELKDLQTAIIVERWDDVVGRWACGSKKRKYFAEFNEKERKRLGELCSIFRDWYLRTGIPQEEEFTIGTIEFIKRAVHFFATV